MGIVIHTDGACRGNPGPGGCAALVDDGTSRAELSRGYRWTTNNRMEIQSVILALETLEPAAPVRLVSDSQYVLNTLSKKWISGWKRKGWINTAREPVKNRDLWEHLDDLVATHAMNYEWVRGHASNPLNTRCDEMAVAAARAPMLATDFGYESNHPFPAGTNHPNAKISPAPPPLFAPVTAEPRLPGFL